MIIEGKYNKADVKIPSETDIEEYAISQIKMICDNPASYYYSNIKVMPDVHPGKIGPIGLVMEGNIDESPIFPGLLGPDIGCGVMACCFESTGRIDFKKLDTVIRDKIPAGSKLKYTPSKYIFDDNIYKDNLSLGTLGGGNHFIEIDYTDHDFFWLVIHTGSRSIGYQIYKKYMDAGHKELKDRGLDVPYEMTHLTGNLKKEYIKEVQECQYYAAYQNRYIISKEISKAMGWKFREVVDTMHNFIELGYPIHNEFILRKGAQKAKLGESVIIPATMSEGILICEGNGNEDWLWSSPHGSGRVYSRKQTKEKFTLSQYKQMMEGIHSISINRDTLDECPMAYRTLAYIEDAVKDTVDIIDRARPIYNFKAGGE